MSRREEKEQQREAAAGGAVAVPPPRRWLDEGAPTTTARWRCGSCAAVVIGDCVALGCCPCAVLSLLGLALVKAPLVVGRRCVGRLRRRRRVLLRKKRVRNLVAASKAACVPDKGDKGAKAPVTPPPGEGGIRKKAAVDAPSEATVATSEPAPAPARGEAETAEMAWLEEMFRVGHWGFGRVSLSGWEEPVTAPP